MRNAPANTYEEAFAQWAPFYRKSYAKRTEDSCRASVADINATLAFHERGVYTGKLYAELDAARDRIQAILSGKG